MLHTRVIAYVIICSMRLIGRHSIDLTRKQLENSPQRNPKDYSRLINNCLKHCTTLGLSKCCVTVLKTVAALAHLQLSMLHISIFAASDHFIVSCGRYFTVVCNVILCYEVIDSARQAYCECVDYPGVTHT
jgi:hypothetical protein